MCICIMCMCDIYHLSLCFVSFELCSICNTSLLSAAIWERYSRVWSLLQLPHHPFSGWGGILQFPQLVWWQGVVPTGPYHRGDHLSWCVEGISQFREVPAGEKFCIEKFSRSAHIHKKVPCRELVVQVKILHVGVNCTFLWGLKVAAGWGNNQQGCGVFYVEKSSCWQNWFVVVIPHEHISLHDTADWH